MSLPITRLLDHLYTVYLFTASDLKTIAVPSSIFGVINAVVLSSSTSDSFWHILKRYPLAFAYVYLNLLPFDIANQRGTEAIAEDSINKAWRPLPSGRITQRQAQILMCCLYAFAVLMSRVLGGLGPSLTLIGLGFWYNDFGGADSHCIVRNLINALGYLSFSVGATEVALNDHTQSGIGNLLLSNPVALKWHIIIGFIVFTTVQIQDLQDQEGDSMRGRKTVPLVFGDGLTRLTLALLLPLWSLLSVWFWVHENRKAHNARNRVDHIRYSSVTTLIVVGGLAAIVVFRLMSAFPKRWELFEKRICASLAIADKKTFKIWNIWIAGIYVVPLAVRLGSSSIDIE